MHLRIGFLGDGHLSRAVQVRVAQDRPYRVVGAVRRDEALPHDVDLLVETATQSAATERLPAAIAAGTDVLLLSIGALANVETRAALQAGPGRLIVTTGAIGGLDQVRALAMAGPITAASIESRKLPRTLVQPWMDAELATRLSAGNEEIVLAEGSAAEVAARFPASANVAAALALAAGSWEHTTARVVADPTAARTRHTVRASGVVGDITAVVRNAPSVERPRSSAVVASAVLRGIDDYARLRGFEAPAGILFL